MASRQNDFSLAVQGSFDPADNRYWVLDHILALQAKRLGGKTFLTLLGESETPSQSYAETDDETNRVAAGLLSWGIGRGEPVGVMMGNSLAYCNTWFGISRAGAVHVAINTEYRGEFLLHVLENCGARILICDAGLAGSVLPLEPRLSRLETLVVVGDPPNQKTGLRMVGYDTLTDASDPPPVSIDYRDIAGIMYTSGTTGPSKGVLMPHAHNYVFGLGMAENLELSEHDIYYISMPLFHANGLLMQLYATLIAGASAVIRPRFSASRWIHDINAHQVTVTNTLGVMNEFLLRQEPSPLDTQHNLRAMAVAPVTESLVRDLRQRFAVAEIIGVYGMTEVNIPLCTRFGDNQMGSCGREYSRFFEVRVVNSETDEPMPPGEVGEIVVRPKQPFAFMAGYHKLPDKTVEAWRNFWFHTGDAATMDQNGYVCFVDRIKDCIRRRGENISSSELESALLQHPDIAEAAAVAVPSEIRGGEDEIKLVIVAEPGAMLTPEVIYTHCEETMPVFALPRYIEITEALPKTPTAKVQKKQLRDLGISANTWKRPDPAR